MRRKRRSRAEAPCGPSGEGSGQGWVVLAALFVFGFLGDGEPSIWQHFVLQLLGNLSLLSLGPLKGLDSGPQTSYSINPWTWIGRSPK
eukprot:5743104-Pyramimonas_sp.AAC.1